MGLRVAAITAPCGVRVKFKVKLIFNGGVGGIGRAAPEAKDFVVGRVAPERAPCVRIGVLVSRRVWLHAIRVRYRARRSRTDCVEYAFSERCRCHEKASKVETGEIYAANTALKIGAISPGNEVQTYYSVNPNSL